MCKLWTGPGGPETFPGQAKGTPAFIAPEQARGEASQVGKASDVFGLGGIGDICQSRNLAVTSNLSDPRPPALVRSDIGVGIFEDVASSCTATPVGVQGRSAVISFSTLPSGVMRNLTASAAASQLSASTRPVALPV
jgi:hypothetical protein